MKMFIGGILSAGAIYFGFENLNRAKVWVSPNGRMSQQNLLDNNSSGLDLWPTAGVHPTLDSLSEITLHRTQWDDPAFEQFSMSAMVDGGEADGAYRFGVERAGTGRYHPILFCFESYTPIVARCPLKLTEDGVYVSSDGGPWRKL